MGSTYTASVISECPFDSPVSVASKMVMVTSNCTLQLLEVESIQLLRNVQLVGNYRDGLHVCLNAPG